MKIKPGVWGVTYGTHFSQDFSDYLLHVINVHPCIHGVVNVAPPPTPPPLSITGLRCSSTTWRAACRARRRRPPAPARLWCRPRAASTTPAATPPPSTRPGSSRGEGPPGGAGTAACRTSFRWTEPRLPGPLAFFFFFVVRTMLHTAFYFLPRSIQIGTHEVLDDLDVFTALRTDPGVSMCVCCHTWRTLTAWDQTNDPSSVGPRWWFHLLFRTIFSDVYAVVLFSKTRFFSFGLVLNPW